MALEGYVKQEMRYAGAGGTAFPCAHEGGQRGMTLRDYFATSAIQGMCSTPTWPSVADGPELAKRAYAMADAMMAERMR